LRIICQVCGVQGYLQHIGKNYFRVRHYVGYKESKPKFKYHKQNPEYVRNLSGERSIGQVGQYDRSTGVDQNLKAYGFFNENTGWAGSLVRIGLRPPKPVVVGSNPTPPAITSTQYQFREYLLGYVKQSTANGYVKMLKVLSKLGDLDNPKQIRTLICTSQVSEGRKELLANAYNYWVKYRGLTWDKPKFTREDRPFFLPLEVELDQLISNTRNKMSTFLQLLKESAVNSGEAWKLRWIDIDSVRGTVNVTPTKNHSSRVLPISQILLTRLFKLPRKNERVFASKNLDKFRWLYERARNLLSAKLENPRLHEIAFRSFRHWKATQLYYHTKDILHVKWFLGHKRLENTLVYTHLVNFRSNDFTCKVARSLKEATNLIEAGFEYVTEMDGVKLFRKRK